MADSGRKTEKPAAQELGAGEYTVRAGCEITLSGVVHRAGDVVRLSDAGAGAHWDCVDKTEPSAAKKKAPPAPAAPAPAPAAPAPAAAHHTHTK